MRASAPAGAANERETVRQLKLDPRPPTYDSVAEVSLGEQTRATVVDDVEAADWQPIALPAPAAPPRLAFVDGVQRLERRISAVGEGWPIPGALVSYAAGAVCCDAEPPLRHITVRRRIILTRGAVPAAVRLEAQNGPVDYLPEFSAGEDFDSLTRTLNDLRAGLETEVVRALLGDGVDLIIVDGRLPDVRQGPIVGLIKTLHDLYISKPEQVACLEALRAGQRSPVFLIQRARSTYYSWFVCLRAPGRFDIPLSGLARLEMDDHTPKAEAFRTADVTAAVLPAYASTPSRDDRAPQNLLPVGQLERELRRRQGDVEYLTRLMMTAFAKEELTWNP
jgi:hypothetical protein